MATKAELAKELIELGVAGTVDSLKRDYRLDELEDMVSELKPKEKTPEVDIEAIKAQLEAQIREELLAEMKEKQEKAVAPQPQKARVSQIDRHRMIPIMSVSSGKLVYVSPRTGMKVVWGDYGDVEYLEMQEVQTMRTANRSFFNEPFAVVLDEEVANYLGLDKMYDKIVSLDNIDTVFRMKQDKFEEVLTESPRGIQVLIINRAKELIDKGEFDSARKIKFINEKFDTILEV